MWVISRYLQSYEYLFKISGFFTDLTRHLVSDYAAIEHLMEQGNTHRYGS